jgi:hypothetical protein
MNHSAGGSDDKIQVCGVGERAEIPVPRKEREIMVDAALGNQGIAETRFAALCQYLRSQLTCPLPITGPDFDERQLRESL